MKKVTAVAAPDCKQSTILLIFNRANQCRTDMAMRHRELLDTKKDRKMLNENCSFSLDFALKLSTNLLFID